MATSLGGVHPRVAVNAMSSRTWSFEQDLQLWRAMGLNQAGLWWRKLDPGRSAKIAALSDAGISAATVVSGTFDLAAPQTWATSRAAIAASVRTAVATGGRSVYITPGRPDGRTWTELLDVFAAAVGPSLANADRQGVRLSIEPSRRSSASFVNSLGDAIDVAKATGVGLVLDFGNCWMERDLERVIHLAGPYLALVQLCDIRLGPDSPSSGDRVVPGDGVLPLSRLLHAVLDTGYDGLFDIELVGPVVEREGYEATVRRAAELSGELLSSMGV